MSTIVTSNVSDGTLSIPTTYVTNGSAKAWVNFNGTGTIAIRDSLNVSSLTDVGTGNYGQTFTSAFANANFNAVLGAGTTSTGASDFHYACADYSVPRTTTAFRFYYFGAGGATFSDTKNVDTTMNGDLA